MENKKNVFSNILFLYLSFVKKMLANNNNLICIKCKYV